VVTGTQWRCPTLPTPTAVHGLLQPEGNYLNITHTHTLCSDQNLWCPYYLLPTEWVCLAACWQTYIPTI
jgi:hypothetical protein